MNALISFNQNLSFLGAVADAGETISRVRITSGANTLVSNGVLGNPTSDFVVMDDFLFAEVRKKGYRRVVIDGTVTDISEEIELDESVDHEMEVIADGQIDRLTDRFYLLAEWPMMGRPRDDLRRGLRSHPVGDYLIFYRVRRREVIIQRVLHARRTDGSTVATLVNWPAHSTVMGSGNRLISGDWPSATAVPRTAWARRNKARSQ